MEETTHKCKCGSEVEIFVNHSYYDMITVRCEKCQEEKDFVTRQEAIEYLNNLHN